MYRLSILATWPIIALAILVLGGCQLSFDLPEGSRLACESNAECPEGYVCSLNFRVCVIAEPVCGDGVVEFPEDCDVTEMSAECDINCTVPLCGDGIHNPLAGESCDDGNTIDDDRCLNTCKHSPRSCGPDAIDCTVLFAPENTVPACDGTQCTFECIDDFCFDEDTQGCVGLGALSPNDACKTCQPGISTAGYTVSPGAICNDNETCTYNDMCQQDGSCLGEALLCENEEGTCGGVAFCDGSDVCQYSYPGSETSCNDEEICSHTDVCTGNGGCTGTVYSCAGNGTCGGDALCRCNLGYTGDLCETCSPGFGDTGDGTCTFLNNGNVDGLNTEVLIPAGTFFMGSPESELGRWEAEGPQRAVTITRDFYMLTHEVTQAEWVDLFALNPSVNHTEETCPLCPVDSVNWFETLFYANFKSNSMGLETCYSFAGCENNTIGTGEECAEVIFAGVDCTGYRVPTEAEWEYAARAGTTTDFYSGVNQTVGTSPEPVLDPIAWYFHNSDNTSQPVQTKEPNTWGLYDTSGNLWEWVWDWASDSYASFSNEDPLGATAPPTNRTDHRVLRGGSFGNVPTDCRSARRASNDHGGGGGVMGFRVVRTAP